jgi:probable rRNA maturation factor
MIRKQVRVLFQAASHFPVNRGIIADAIETALQDKIKRWTEVSVLVVGDRQMRKLNRTYRQIDATTDVLSFPLSESSVPAAQFIDPPDGILRLGDIVVSYPQAVKHATQSNRMVDDVIKMLVLHGLDHLMGIHHPE